MSTRTTIASLLVAVALVGAACTSASDEPAPTTTTTTGVVGSTTSTPETTTTVPLPTTAVSVVGDVGEDIASAVAGFLSAVQESDSSEAGFDPLLLEHHAALAGELAESYEATAATQELSTGGAVGVVTLDTGDIVLVADDDGNGWSVVGAEMASFGVDPWFGESPSRVLVLGSDARPGETPGTSRTDSIHILTAVPAQQAGTIMGFPRDSYVSTPYGDMRINAITTSGRGPGAVYDFFTDNWEIPLDGYVLTAFEGFEDVVDASVGLLQIDLPRPVPSIKYWDGFPEGEQTLTPPRTLDLARTRKGLPGGDFTRSLNQGVIMTAVLTMFQQGDVSDIPMLVGELVKYTETNLTPTQLVQLGASAFALDIGKIDNIVLPGKLGRAAGGASVVFLEPDAEDIIADVVEDGLLTPTDG